MKKTDDKQTRVKMKTGDPEWIQKKAGEPAMKQVWVDPEEIPTAAAKLRESSETHPHWAGALHQLRIARTERVEKRNGADDTVIGKMGIASFRHAHRYFLFVERRG